MDRLRLRRLLNKFKKDDLYSAISRWGRIDVPTNLNTKAQLISYVIEESLAANVTGHDINCLELDWISSNSNKTKWTAYQLTPFEGTAVSDSLLENDFSKELQPLLSHNTSHRLVEGVNWVIIRVKDTCKDYSCYITHRSRSDVVFVSNMRKKHLDTILLALCNTLRCGEWRDIKLSGHDLQSLVDLTHYKHCQGSFSHYQPQYNKSSNPLFLLHKSGSLQQGTSEVNAAPTQEETRRRAAQSVFGKNPLPRLESHTLEVECLDTPQHRTVCRLKGTNILKGLEKAVITNRLTLPIPQVIISLPETTSTHIACTDPG
ncbi:uncharacterized protein [Dysidea avara]|uniref:uncharacterized protein n=1 Tax=Dysidea avara TaxID=196820 RepID=UPI003321C1E1